ncbi:MAG: DUF2207 domain-containing protein [Bacillota bacterium]
MFGQKRLVTAIFLTVVFGLVLAAALLNPAVARAEDDRSFYFPSLLIEAAVQPDGSMTVVEERTYSFNGPYRGAWQYIHLKHNASIRDILVSENGVPYEQMPPGTQDIPGIFYVEQHPDHVYIDWSYEAADEWRTFTISYTVDNAVMVHEDKAELYYQFIGNEWDVRTDYARVILTLPAGSVMEDLLVWGHGPLYGEVRKESPTRVVWEVERLPSRTFLEGRAVFPVELVPQSANLSGKDGLPGILKEEEEWANKANLQRKLLQLDFILGPVLLLTALLVIFIVRRKATRDPAAFSGDYYRELPGEYSPAEAGYLHRRGSTNRMILPLPCLIWPGGAIYASRNTRPRAA